MTKYFVTICFITMIFASTIFRVLGDEIRWRIVRLVVECPLCVCELADILKMPQSSISSHVQIIRKAGLLESERCGKWTYFRIHPKHVPLISFLITNTPQAAHHKVDAKHAVSRLKDRENSCCPGPQKLAKP